MAQDNTKITAVSEQNLGTKVHSISFWLGIFSALGGIVTTFFPNLSGSQVKTLEDAAAIVVTLILSGTAVALVHMHNAAKLAQQQSNPSGG